MKKIIATLFILLGILSCSKDSKVNNNNPYIPNYSFSIEVNLNLPLYAELQHAGNGKLITTNGAGANGVILFNAGSSYKAYEASCPNQYLSSCSRLEVDGSTAFCPCDDSSYNLFTGLPLPGVSVDYGLIPYRIQKTGDIIRIYN